MSGRMHYTAIGLLVVAAVAVAVGAVWSGRNRASFGVRATVAEVQPVHAPVSVDGKEVRAIRRVGAGGAIETGADGRGRARLDDGTTLVIDRASRFRVMDGGIDLAEGRLFVQVPSTARTKLSVGVQTAIASGAALALERHGVVSKVFCASGEVTVQDPKGVETRVHSGETASAQGEAIQVAPEAAFEDWTAGMASPWSASGSPRRAIGELWGRLGNVLDGDAGTPLTIRSSEVTARVVEELAHTRVRTTYFNAGGGTVRGDFRMAIPRGGTVDEFTIERGETRTPSTLRVADRTRTEMVPPDARLEWAGDGWLRGTLPAIEPGATVSIVVGWYEWLSPSGGRLLYRYPLSTGGDAPRIGEFLFTADFDGAHPSALLAGSGAMVLGKTVSLRKSDFVPTSDIVVEAEVERADRVARAYVAPWTTDRGNKRSSDTGGDYLVVRTELPDAKPDDGVTLAMVLDVSGSIDPSLLDAERALVEALLRGLGERDRVAVFAADEGVSAVGPEKVTPMTEEARKTILGAMAALRPGGATDLGRALERGADAIPPDAPAGMVIYVGDGWPTVGDTNVDEIEARLARRADGLPRVGAVAVGPMANRFALSALVRGSGPVLEIRGREDAAATAVELLAEALRPAVGDVEVSFPPGVERVYPRGAHAQVAGTTVQVVGRIVGKVPDRVVLKWRDASGTHAEERRLERRDAGSDEEVRRRWAAARVEELAFRMAGREAATDVAAAEGLLTPWTAWVVGASGGTYVPTPIDTRVLDLAGSVDSPYSALLSTPSGAFGTLTDPLNEPEEDPKPDADEYRAAVRAAGQRVIEAAGKQIRACRDARVALRPDIRGTLRIQARVNADGQVEKVAVTSVNLADNDPILNDCVSVVVRGIRFPETTLTGSVEIEYRFDLPPPRPMAGRRCSPASLLPLGLRRGIWLERLRTSTPPDQVYLSAKQACELKEWSDKRALLEIVLSHVTGGVERVSIARQLAEAGEEDAASLLRREAMRRAREPRELWAIRLALVGNEKLPVGEFRKQYKAATSNEARLAVVRRFLPIAPHDSGLRRRLFALLEATGQREALVSEVMAARQDPLADAALLADGAAALRRVGYEAEARRGYGELAERAADDPAVRAYLGDRLRAEGWFDEATATYRALEELAPDEPSTLLRLSLAHAGAGRLDIATRMLARLAHTGGRSGDDGAAQMATQVGATLVIEASARQGVAADTRAQLLRRALEFPWPHAATIVLVRTPRLLRPVQVALLRGPSDARERREPEGSMPAIGLYSFALQPGDEKDIDIQVRRAAALQPESKVPVEISILRAGDDLSEAAISRHAFDAAADGEVVTWHYDGAAFSAKK
jgi:tetratricopeptide (TPR) repeat protein